MWAAVVGEELVCRRERGNSHNVYAVAVMKDGVVVGQEKIASLARKKLPVTSVFLMNGGTVLCQVFGRRRHSRDLPQGGLEISCLLLFKGTQSRLINWDVFLATHLIGIAIIIHVHVDIFSLLTSQLCTS